MLFHLLCALPIVLPLGCTLKPALDWITQITRAGIRQQALTMVHITSKALNIFDHIAVSTKSRPSYGCWVITLTVKVACQSLAHHCKVPVLFSLSSNFSYEYFLASLNLNAIQYIWKPPKVARQPKVDY